MHVTHEWNPLLMTYRMNGRPIEDPASHTYLGISINNKLNCDEHIGNTVSKASKILGLLCQSLYSCSPFVKETIYKLLVEKSMIFKCYSSRKHIALNTLHEVVPTWYSFHSWVGWSNADKVSCSRTQHTDARVRTVYLCIQKTTFQPNNQYDPVRPKLEDCSRIWDPYHQEYENKLESVQCRAARFVCRDFRCQSHVSDMLRDLNWKTLEEHRIISRLTLLHKSVHNIVAINIDEHYANMKK